MIRTINNPSRVTRKTATPTDHILTNHIINLNIKTPIFKIDILDHFPVCIIISSKEKLAKNKYTYVYKRVITYDATESFNQVLYESDWVQIETSHNPFECYKLLFKKCLTIYKDFFPKKKKKLKVNPLHATDLFLYPLKTSKNLWFTDVFRGNRKRPVA